MELRKAPLREERDTPDESRKAATSVRTAGEGQSLKSFALAAK
jgi:hypothetical protein